MSPARTPTRSAYRAPRSRREVALAVLCVLSVLVVTAVLIWVFAPEDEAETFPTDVTIPTGMPSTPAPATTLTSTPG